MKKLLALYVFTFLCFASYGQELQPTDSDAVLKVSVIDFDKKPLTGEKVTFLSEKAKKLYSGVTDATGKFEILIPKGSIYQVKYKQYTSDAEYGKKLTIPAAPDELLTFNYVIRIQLPKTFTLNNVFFDVGKATLRPQSDKELNELAECMKQQKTMTIEVAGYTDNVGSDANNQKLSQDRAESVRTYLLKKGIAAERIKAKGYGSSNPVAPNDSPQGRQQNRRTEIHVLTQ